jgi:hypothetical protein
MQIKTGSEPDHRAHAAGRLQETIGLKTVMVYAATPAVSSPDLAKM